MSEVLMNTCGPLLTSTYSHTSRQTARCHAVSAPPFYNLTSNARPVSDSRVTPFPLTDYDHDIILAASKSLPLSREPSPCLEAPRVTHLDDAVMNDDDQGQAYKYSSQTQPIQQEQPDKDSSGVRRQDIFISPTSSTSANSMPTPQLTFTEATTQAEEGLAGDEDEDEEELSASPSDGEEEGAVERVAKTAAERLAEKRKMKRFRLTHSQTRFLMSEFSRQPHPNAAQRERLSKDIPGLSSRQVQVWFQNRRAKMKRLTGDDQERMMRSRALPTGFNLSGALQPSGGEQSLSPSSLTHFAGSGANPAGGSQIGRSFSRTDRRDVPPINMALIYRNPSYSLSSAGESTNVSPSTSISGDLTYSANQSPPMFSGSQAASPFLRAGGDSFQTNLAPANFSLSPSNTFRGRSGSLMNLSSSSSLPGGDSLTFPHERGSMENMQAPYQSQYQGSDQQASGFDPQLGSMANLQMQSPSYQIPPGYPSMGGLMRRNSSGAMLGSGSEESYDSGAWFNLPSSEQLPNAELQLQTHPIRRRLTQPTQPTQQHQPSGMAILSPATPPHRSFRSTTFPQARQSSSLQPLTPYEPTAALHGEVPQAHHPFFGEASSSTTHWQSTADETLSPTDIYQQQQQQQQQSQNYQAPSYTGYYQSPSAPPPPPPPPPS